MQTVKTKKPGQLEFVIPDFYNVATIENLIPKKESYTYGDYAKLPEGAPYQLICGKLIMTPSPTPFHQKISRKLESKIDRFLDDKDLGELFHAPLDVFFNNINVYQPDILFISKEREGIIGDKKIEGAPDIVIEILSPSTAYYDMREKFGVYEKYGVKEYWLIDSKIKKVQVFENIGNKFELCNEAEGEGNIFSKELDGLRIFINDIF